jgi:hypothetical protein
VVAFKIGREYDRRAAAAAEAVAVGSQAA